MLPAMLGKLLGLPLADVSGGVGRFHLLRSFPNHLAAGGLGKFGQFLERLTQLVGTAGFQFDAYEEDPFRPRVSGLD